MRGERGHSLMEMMTALAVAALLAVAAFPMLATLRARALMSGASFEIATLLRSTRSRAIEEGRSVALVFRAGAGGWRVTLVADGDGDGVKAADLDAGTDYPLAQPRRIADRWSGVEFGFLPIARVRRLPPSRLWLESLDDPVQFGSSDIVSFSPGGEASSGSLYLADAGGQMAAVVLYGQTARVRVFRYDVAREEWRGPGTG